MIFENPINKRVKKLEEQLNNTDVNLKKEEKDEVLKEDINDNIISLNDILNTSSNYSKKIEMIDYPNGATITDVPRELSLNSNQIGSINIKYSNKLDDSINKAM